MIPLKRNKAFKSHSNEGIYQVVYSSNAGDFSGGFKPKAPDLLTLEKVGGHALAPRLIVVSEYELLENFSVYNPLSADVPEAEPSTKEPTE